MAAKPHPLQVSRGRGTPSGNLREIYPEGGVTVTVMPGEYLVREGICTLAPHTHEVARLKEVDIRSEIWAARYPRLAKMKWSLEPPEGISREVYYDDPDFALNPSYSIIRDNVLCQCGACWSNPNPAVEKYSDFTEEGNLLLDEIPAFQILDDGTIQLPADSVV